MLKFILVMLGSFWLIRSLFGLINHYRFYHWLVEQYRIARPKSVAVLYLMVCFPSLVLLIAYLIEAVLKGISIQWIPVILVIYTFMYAVVSFIQVKRRRSVLIKFYTKGGLLVWVNDWQMFFISMGMFYFVLK